jgi:hypothetical protein
MVVHHIPRENLSTFIALYVALTLFVSTTPSFHTVSKNFLETVLNLLSQGDRPEKWPLDTTTKPCYLVLVLNLMY